MWRRGEGGAHGFVSAEDTKKRNGMVNLAQQRKREKNRNELMSMLLLFLLSLYMVALLCDLLQLMSVRNHGKRMTMMLILPNRALTIHLHSNSPEKLLTKHESVYISQGCITE